MRLRYTHVDARSTITSWLCEKQKVRITDKDDHAQQHTLSLRDPLDEMTRRVAVAARHSKSRANQAISQILLRCPAHSLELRKGESGRLLAAEAALLLVLDSVLGVIGAVVASRI